jgi:hypothetical protein
MVVYLVTSKSESRDIAGNLEWATTNFHGIFTNEDRAIAIADKYDGAIIEAHVDMENMSKLVVQTWDVAWSR